mmetsp:Transcript_133219/g.426167  ORF Transcript_133219/g.426167 Transcript_133219/m.426167 type:complete len:205 (+) Transcript_133219:94-708(+)
MWHNPGQSLKSTSCCERSELDPGLNLLLHQVHGVVRLGLCQRAVLRDAVTLRGVLLHEPHMGWAASDGRLPLELGPTKPVGASCRPALRVRCELGVRRVIVNAHQLHSCMVALHAPLGHHRALQGLLRTRRRAAAEARARGTCEAGVLEEWLRRPPPSGAHWHGLQQAQDIQHRRAGGGCGRGGQSAERGHGRSNEGGRSLRRV